MIAIINLSHQYLENPVQPARTLTVLKGPGPWQGTSNLQVWAGNSPLLHPSSFGLELFPRWWENEDLCDFPDTQKLWKATATVTTYFQDDNISVKLHMNFWAGQPGITAGWPNSALVYKCTAGWTNASRDTSLVCKYQCLPNYFFLLLYLSI